MENENRRDSDKASAIPDFSSWISNAVRLSALGLASLLFAAWACPVWFDWFESSSGRLEYEAAVRTYLTFAAVFALGVSFFICWPRWEALQRSVWKALGLSSILLVFIFFQDWGSRLMEEDSWIRYPTAFALILAGIGAAVCVFRIDRGTTNRIERILWSVLAVGFCFGGLDELLEIHEGAARALRISSYPSLTGDLITIGYAVAGFTVVAFLWYAARRSRTLFESGAVAFGEQAMRTFQRTGTIPGYVAAVLVFGVAQSLDTLDKPVLQGLRYGAGQLAGLGHQFPDLWYLLYQPRHFMNSLEEVLELTAAMLFLVYTWWTVKEIRNDLGSPSPAETGGHHARFLRAGRIAFFSLLLILVAYGSPRALLTTPLASHHRSDLRAEPGTVELTALDISSPLNGSDGDLSTEIRLAAIGSVVTQGRFGEILFSGAEGRVDRLRLRRMFRDSLRGLASGGPDDFYFVTAGDPSTEFLPPIAWRIRFSSELGQAALGPLKPSISTHASSPLPGSLVSPSAQVGPADSRSYGGGR